ncbi:Lrp/AsnC family transcriptional regulator [Halopiger aswanensis]|uniref:DNA-binding Lrp family transcriptional regulator n=1 Tax=Halopiger aswanensis TaxID=148449 RepID=A0A3R7HKN7_9EURY|nr:Lrp/AsnC family transcriptional regulator [Halopiger aswanensis]RKD97936.1 DNA-binding Lrp family transcriptional regulator [Halopiger aswanensis]
MDLDATNRAILHLLQRESRSRLTHDEVAEQVGVSSSTVSNRLQDLKERGILQEYRPVIDYERAGVPHHLLFICTAAIADRGPICEQTIEISGVVNVRELLAGTRNLHVEAIAMESGEIERIAEELDALGLEIEGSEILRNEYARPFDGFGREELEGESDSDPDSEQP